MAGGGDGEVDEVDEVDEEVVFTVCVVREDRGVRWTDGGMNCGDGP